MKEAVGRCVASPQRLPSYLFMRWKGLLSRKVYAHGRQFEIVPELQNAIRDEWDNLQPRYLKSLTNSMPDRVFATIQAKGGHTKY